MLTNDRTVFNTDFSRRQIRWDARLDNKTVITRGPLQGVSNVVDTVPFYVTKKSSDNVGWSSLWATKYQAHVYKFQGRCCFERTCCQRTLITHFIMPSGACQVMHPYKFVYFDKIASAGSASDATMFKLTLATMMVEGEFSIGDKAYEGLSHALSPWKGKVTMDELAKYLFNYSLSANRAIIENAFSRWARFKVTRAFRGDICWVSTIGYVLACLVNADLDYRPLRKTTEKFWYGPRSWTDVENAIKKLKAERMDKKFVTPAQ